MKGLRSTLVVAALVLGAGSARAQGFGHDCAFCHVTHGSVGPGLLIATDIEVLCLSCHGAAGSSSLKGEVHTNSGGTFRMSCIDCHTPHSNMPNWQGGTNLKRVGWDDAETGFATITTPNSGIRDVVYESRGTSAGGASLHSFADDDEDGNGVWDGVCEVCHTQTSHHINSGPDPTPKHYVGDTCTDCHAHTENFMPSGGGCTECHNQVQGSGSFLAGTLRRAVVDDPATTGTIEGDFQNSIGGHHIGVAPSDFVCVVCHREGVIDDAGTPGDPSDDTVAIDGTYHNAGTLPYTIDLRNVDHATDSYPVRTDPTSWPAGAGPNGTYGSPSNVYKNNLTNFCLGCHDSDGASVVYSVDPSATGSSTNPFGDGASPLNVYDKFLTGNYSSHAIASNLDAGFGPKYSADWASPGDPGIKASTFVNGWGSAAVTECADCHLGQDPGGTPSYYHNGHGGRNLDWLLIDKDGFDQAVDHGTNAPDESPDGTVLCFRCHDPVTYTTSESGSGSSSRFEKHGQNGHSDSSANVFGIGCLNCHGGDTLEPINGGTLVKGGIHGTNRDDAVDLTKQGAPVNAYARLRFTNGAALDRWTGEGAGASGITCSAQARPAFGHNLECTQHGTQSYTQNYD